MFGYYSCVTGILWLEFYDCSVGKDLCNETDTWKKAYQPPTKHFTSTKFFELAELGNVTTHINLQKDGPDSHNFKWNLILPGKFFNCQAFESIFVKIPTKFHTSELPISVMETVMSTEHIMY